ncbi:bifunctional DNA primase/polymerase [Archangium minus]|uniref:bifunctional DNA primase/polymerase n=1 Tax=Archangium minus TaxID=83450 RepID=UPI0037C0F3FB
MAVIYASKLGWRVVPLHFVQSGGACSCPKGDDCRSAGKHPRLKDWTTEATTDPEQIAAWWRIWPDANVGVVTGSQSGVFVLDVDPRSGGRESLAALEAEHGPLPLTALQATPSGGFHYVFKAVPGLTNSAGKLGPGLDIRAEGGQFVVAPSQTTAGRYRWVRPPWETPPADAPVWLLERLRRMAPAQAPDADLRRGYFPPASPEVLEQAREALAQHGPAIVGQGGDTHTFMAAAILTHDFALTDDEAWPLLFEWNETCVPPWDETDLRAKLRGGGKYGKAEYGCRRKPAINLVAGKLSEIATQAELALVGAGVPVFSRGGALVRPVVEEVDAAHGRRTKVARLAKLDATYTCDLLSRHVCFQRFNAKSGEWLTADPPQVVAQTILSRVGEWRFHPLAGVITTQTMRPDGTILDQPGFDPATRLVLMAPPPMPAIPNAPTRRDAEQALRLLSALLEEFPFVDDACRSVALSGLITPVVRGAFSVAPGHAASASTPGTGKSFLWDTSAAICTGQPMPVMAAGRTEEESEKRLGAAVIAGQPVVALDNVNGGIGGDAFCQVIERPVVDVRILGRSELARVESRATVFVTGNNLQILGDATRRVLLVRLDANMERPELRQFKSNPVATVLADRGRYVAAALTVVRAFVAAGSPGRAPRLASFEGWSDTVRSSLIWLGCADPVATMEAARAEDPLMALLRAALGSWASHFGTGRATARTAADVLRIAEGFDAADTFPALKEAVLAVASNRGRPDARTFGKWLSRHKGRIVAGFRLEGEADAHGHAARWWVERHGTAVDAVSAVDSERRL